MKKGMRTLLFVFFLALSCGAGISADAKSKSKAAKPYVIKINKQQNVVTVYRHKKGEQYTPYKAFVCSSGAATPIGTFSLGEKMRWHVLNGPSYGQYCCRIYKGFLFHSVWYHHPSKDSQSYVQYNRLGTTASHGCVRLTVWDAKWIYDNCPSGTKIMIYNSANPGPLGKPRAVKVSGYSGWDPTDPDPANPYQKRQPSLGGVGDGKVTYGSKVKLMKGVTARDSFGANMTSKVRTEIAFKALPKDRYKKVRKVDSKIPGTYKVTYSVTDILHHTAKKTAVLQVVPKVRIKSIKLSAPSKTLYVGGKASEREYRLKVGAVRPKKASYKKVRYTTSDKKIATVSQKGVVRARKAGKAVIKVLALDGSGKTAVCRVTVRKAPGKSQPGGQTGIPQETQPPRNPQTPQEPQNPQTPQDSPAPPVSSGSSIH